MSFELTETYSLAKIKEALSSPALDRYTTRDVINLYRRVKDSPNNKIHVTYKKKGKHGRYYPTSGHHQACYQWKHLRATLSEGETDIDAVNCAPTIFTALCRQLGMQVDYLQRYLDNRQQFIDDLDLTQTEIDNHNEHTKGCYTKYDIGKSVFNAFLNGASRNTYWKDTKTGMHLGKDVIKTKSMSHQLIKEMELGIKTILNNQGYKHYSEEYKRGAIFYVITDIEAYLVRELMRKFKTSGITVTKYMFDGFHVSSTDNNKIDDILKGYVNDYDVKFIRKPFPDTLDKLTLVHRTPQQIEADLKRLESVYAYTDLGIAKLCCARTDVKLVNGMLVKYSAKVKRYIEIEPRGLINDMDITMVHEEGNEDPNYLKNAKGMRNVREALNQIWKEEMVNQPDFITNLNKKTKHKVFFKCGHWYDLKTKETGLINENCAQFWCIDRELPDFKEYSMEHPDVVDVDTKIMNIFRDDMKPHVYYALARALGGNALDDKLTYLIPGERYSGKSALMKACQTLIGQFPLGPVTTMDVLQVSPNSSTDAKALSTLLTQNIDKARICFGSELRNENYPINGNVYKQLQGGDDITARTNHKDEKTVKNNCTYFLCFNPPKGKTLPDISPPDTIQACKVWFMPYVFLEKPEREFERFKDITLWDKMINNKQNWGDAFLWLLAEHYEKPEEAEPEDWTEPAKEHTKATTLSTIDIFYDLYEFDEDEWCLASQLREDLNLDLYNINPWLKRKFKSKAEVCNGFKTRQKNVDGKLEKVYCGFKRKIEVNENNECLL
jgi:hypothetical protein